jgi:acetylornithine deacetylase/succinyl-diaminopimelate desuccinylase-like protein
MRALRAAPVRAALLLASTLGAVAAPATETPQAVRDQARELFREIVAMHTSAGLGQVPVLAEHLAARFRAAGFPAEDVRVLPLVETAALVVRYRGDGSGGKPILVLAHMDVVPARPEDWKRDPFTLVEESGYFFGRGTADIKQEVALIATTFIRLKSEGFVPTRDLYLVYTGDEETTMATTRLLAKRPELAAAEYALNGDGGGGVLAEADGKAQVYYLQGAEKSYATFELTLRNPGGHSSAPRTDNAIYELATVLKAIEGYAFPVMTNEWNLGSLKASAAARPGPLGDAMARFAKDPTDAQAIATLSADPMYVGRIRTTCVATMLRAGHAENALPQSATATVNCRIFPGTRVAEVQAALQRLAGDAVEIAVIGVPTEGPASPLREDVLEAVAKAVHASHPGVPIVPDMAPYATDGSIFRGAGIPTYGVSSTFIKDTDSFAHGLDERIPVDEFYAGLVHWHVLLRTVAGRP